MNCIIIGDRYQKGMKSKGCAGLIKFDKYHNIFQHQYTTIKKYFPKINIFYIGGFESKKLENFLQKHYADVRFIHNINFETSNDAYSLYLAKDILNNDTLILFGYTVFTKTTLDKFNKNIGSQIFMTNNQNDSIGCVINNNRIENISFDLPDTINDIYYIASKDIEYFKNKLDNKYHNYFLFELLNDLIDNHNITITPFYSYIQKAKYYEHTK